MTSAVDELLTNQFKAIVDANGKIIDAVKTGMAADYARLLKNLKFVVSNAHESYATAGSLNYVEMQRYNRIKSYQAKLDKVVAAETKPIYLKISQGMKDVTQNTYSESISVIGGVAGIDLGSPLSADEIQSILNKPWTGVTLQQRLGLRRTDIGSRIKSRAVQGLIRNENYADTAKGLREVVLKDYAWNGNMAESMGHQYQSDATQEAFDTATDAGIVVTKTWVTAGDDKVRDDHAALDGQTVNADEMFTIPSGPNQGMQADGPGLFGIPEEDINCRCWIVGGIEE
jgi:hypothetical protein